ncbi:MAG TPA: amidohydrolase family protein [Burkholderiales bacterium]|jgi:predicted TIM-barrel fold metal-dependent hydrolase
MNLVIPYTAGTGSPREPLPANACDSHIHIYDAALSDSPSVLAQATAENYRRLQARNGTSRTVIIQPAAHVFDNRVTLNGIAALGAERTRGVAVVSPEVTDAELQHMHAGGIRGIRFTMFNPKTAVTRFEWVEGLAARVAEFGWHVQIHWRGDQIVEHAAILNNLKCTIVFDHMARLPRPEAEKHPAFGIVARLLENGCTWVKLSGPYLDDAAPDYATRAGVVRAFCQRAPERLVWGSDWPHPTEEAKPDDARMLDLFGEWIGDISLRNRILVDNPARLYGFK